MRFTKTIAVAAIMSLAVNANSQEVTATSTTVVQPTTVVEAAPAADSKAELMRKARQNAEVQTEQKIVEKLEESRLKEEQERAQRLFGDKLDSAAPAAAAPVEAAKEEKPTQQITIEKVEIVQPAPVVEAPKAEVVETPVVPVVAESTAKIEDTEEQDLGKKTYVSGILGVPAYQASNVKSHYGIGVAVGIFTSPKWAVEGSFLYSNSSVDTFWDPDGIFRNLDQYDVQGAAKYYLMEGQLRPYVGGSLTYIYRKYDDRIRSGTHWGVNSFSHQEETHSVNAGLLAGVDFQISDEIVIGGGLDYNWNMMANTFDTTEYGIPTNTKALEEIEYWTLKLNAKYRF